MDIFDTTNSPDSPDSANTLDPQGLLNPPQRPSILHFGSAGVQGITYIGVLLAKNESPNYFNSFKTIQGTSIGAIAALAYCLELDYFQIQNLKIYFTKIAKAFTPSLVKFFASLSFCNASFLEEMIDYMLQCKSLSPTITFGELQATLKYTFKVALVNVESQIYCYATSRSFKDVSVKQLLLAATAIPFVFDPQYFLGTWWIDGAFHKDDEKVPNNCLLIRVESATSTLQLSSEGKISKYIYLQCMLKLLTAKKVPQNSCVIQNCPLNFAAFFSVTSHVYDKMVKLGYSEVMTYLRRLE